PETSGTVLPERLQPERNCPIGLYSKSAVFSWMISISFVPTSPFLQTLLPITLIDTSIRWIAIPIQNSQLQEISDPKITSSIAPTMKELLPVCSDTRFAQRNCPTHFSRRLRKEPTSKTNK